MALGQSALLEVLDALKAAEVDDHVRQAAQTIYQAPIEAERGSTLFRVLRHSQFTLHYGHQFIDLLPGR